jgi:uncharacterized membrane protein YebE (DUF533 family)
MSLFGVITGAVGLGADFGLSALIGNVATTVTTKSGNKLIDKICIGIGTAVLSGMAGEAAQNYIQRKADELKKAIVPAWAEDDLLDEDFDDDFIDEEVDANE